MLECWSQTCWSNSTPVISDTSLGYFGKSIGSSIPSSLILNTVLCRPLWIIYVPFLMPFFTCTWRRPRCPQRPFSTWPKLSFSHIEGEEKDYTDEKCGRAHPSNDCDTGHGSSAGRVAECCQLGHKDRLS